MTTCACCGQGAAGNPQATTTIWVDEKLLSCCNRAHQAASSRGAAEVGVLDLLEAAVDEPDHAAVLDRFGLAAHALGTLCARALADIGPASGTSSEPQAHVRTSDELRLLLERAHHGAKAEGRQTTSFEDVLGALVWNGTDLPSSGRICAWRFREPSEIDWHATVPASRHVPDAPLERHSALDARLDPAFDTERPAAAASHHELAPSAANDQSERVAEQSGGGRSYTAGKGLRRSLRRLRRISRRAPRPREAAPQFEAMLARLNEQEHLIRQLMAQIEAFSVTLGTFTPGPAELLPAPGTASTQRNPRARRLRRMRLRHRSRARLVRIRRAARLARRTSSRASAVIDLQARPAPIGEPIIGGTRAVHAAVACARADVAWSHASAAEDDNEDLDDQVVEEIDTDDGGEPVAGREKRFYLTLDDDIERAPSIGPKTADRLRPLGIGRVRDLLRAEPGALSARLGARHITPSRIAAWQDQARLVCTIPWLRGTHAQLFVGAGYRTVEAIREEYPGTLCGAVLAFVTTREGQRVLRAGPPPEIDRIMRWIGHTLEAEPARAAA